MRTFCKTFFIFLFFLVLQCVCHFNLSSQIEQPINQINYLQNDYQTIAIISENLNNSEIHIKNNDNVQSISFNNDFCVLSNSKSLTNHEKSIANSTINKNTNLRTGLISDVQIRAP